MRIGGNNVNSFERKASEQANPLTFLKQETSEGERNGFEAVGKYIVTLLEEDGVEESQDISLLITTYFSTVVEQIEDLEIGHPLCQYGIAIMKACFKRNRLMEPAMIEFYLWYRVKESNFSVCKKIDLITSPHPDHFGNFQTSTGTMQIYYRYLEERFRPALEKFPITDEKKRNEFLNQAFLQMLSHELGHVNDAEKIEQLTKQKDILELLADQEDHFFNYWYRSGLVRLVVGETYYNECHENFLNEIRADLFSYLDFSIQVNGLFKDAFSEESLYRRFRWYADNIVSLYTMSTEEGLKGTSPMQKFDLFFETVLPGVYSPASSINETEVKEGIPMIERLLLGDMIPNDGMKKLVQIAKGQQRTMNLYADLQAITYSQNPSVFSETEKGSTRK